MPTYLDFEAPLAELEGKIAELRALPTGDKTVSISDEVKGLEKKAAKQLTDLYANLEPWQKAQVARHPERGKTGPRRIISRRLRPICEPPSRG